MANAGPDQSANLSDTVILDGSASSDVDGDPLTYDWSLTAVPLGSAAALNDNTAVNPEFTLDLAGTYTAQLVVNDGLVDSAPDTVSVSTNNTRPVANAGPDQTPEVGSTATLDGSASNDADGDPITYAWSLISAPIGSTASPSTPNNVTTDLNIDLPGTYVAQLIVNDGIIDSLPDTITLITQNRAPIADAGPDQSIEVLQTATFNGVASSDPDGDPLTYAWSIIGAPGGSTATLVDGNTQTPELTPDVEGTYTLQLIVNDGTVDSAPDTVELTATAALQTLTIALDSARVGLARSINGTVTLGLPAPAGGVTVNLSSDLPGIATVAPTSVIIPEADTSASFTVTGVTEGGAVISASATGFSTDTTPVQVTSALITLGDPGDLAPGQSASIAVSISAPAPAGGLTINLASSNPSVVSVDASVFIPEGAQVPAANPQVTGDQIGTATITATGDLFAPDSRDINVTLSITLTPDPFTVVESSVAPMTVTLSAPSPTGGLTLDLLSGDPSIATVPATVVVPQGQLTAQFDVTGVTPGNTTVDVSAPGVANSQLAIEVIAAPPINISDVTVGFNLQTTTFGTLGQAAPAGNVQVTLTSADPASVLLSTSATGAGSGSIVVQVNAGSNSLGTIYVQGLANSGTVDVTASAPGYSDGTFTVTLANAGFYISTNSFSTTSFSSNRTVRLRSARLADGTNNFAQVQSVRGGLSVDVTVTSSDPVVGTINSPAVFASNISLVDLSFDPDSAGTTDLSVTQPAGFIAPANQNSSITATVTAPDVNLGNGTVGDDLQTTVSFNLDAAPPTPTDVVVTVSNPLVAVVSNSATTPGSGSITYSGVTSTNPGQLFIQGLSLGTTTISATANGYNAGSATITVNPSGFYISTANFTTTTFSSNRTVRLRSVMLNSANLNFQQIQSLRAGFNQDVVVTSSDTVVGTINSPAAFVQNINLVDLQFDPENAGTTDLMVLQPVGFETPANQNTQITATVTAPGISLADFTVGQDLQSSSSISLAAAPPVPTDVTVTIADPTVALISADPNAVGSSSVTFSGVTGTTFAGTIYVQGLQQNQATTLTTTATGFSADSSTVNVHPSGFYIQTNDFTTNSFANNRSVRLRSVRLNPANNNFSSIQNIRGGISVNVVASSSDVGVGTITSPAAFATNTNLVDLSFDPISSGTTDLSIAQPAGFTVPANQNTSITATVNAPVITIGNANVGVNLQQALNVFLESAPPSPVDVIISSNAPGIAIISDDADTVGSNSITVSGVTGTFVDTIYVQGLATGDTTITVTAAGYTDGNGSVDVDPAGFTIITGNFSVNAGAGPRNIQVRSSRLNPTTLNRSTDQPVRGGLSVNVDITSSAPAVGAILTSPLVFNNGNVTAVNTQLDPLTAGTTQVSIAQPTVPSGFTLPSNNQFITVTVNP